MAKSVGSHSVSNTRCHGMSVDDCAKTENLYRSYEAVLRPSTVLGLKSASYAVYRVLCRSQSAIKMPSKVAAGALIFTCTPSYIHVVILIISFYDPGSRALNSTLSESEILSLRPKVPRRGHYALLEPSLR